MLVWRDVHRETSHVHTIHDDKILWYGIPIKPSLPTATSHTIQYGIFPHIWLMFMVDVGTNIPYMDAMGCWVGGDHNFIQLHQSDI